MASKSLKESPYESSHNADLLRGQHRNPSAGDSYTVSGAANAYAASSWVDYYDF